MIAKHGDSWHVHDSELAVPPRTGKLWRPTQLVIPIKEVGWAPCWPPPKISADLNGLAEASACHSNLAAEAGSCCTAGSKQQRSKKKPLEVLWMKEPYVGPPHGNSMTRVLISGIILPIDELIFFKGGWNHQPGLICFAVSLRRVMGFTPSTVRQRCYRSPTYWRSRHPIRLAARAPWSTGSFPGLPKGLLTLCE